MFAWGSGFGLDRHVFGSRFAFPGIRFVAEPVASTLVSDLHKVGLVWNFYQQPTYTGAAPLLYLEQTWKISIPVDSKEESSAPLGRT